MVLDPLRRLYGFQFHKGTIKTGANATVYCKVSKFQFHKGTIKTLCSKD